VAHEPADLRPGPRQEILQAGERVLRQTARELSVDEVRSPRIQDLIGRMRDTMRAAPGVGLAAPQIGESLQLAVVEDRAEYLDGMDPAWIAERERVVVPFCVLINPRLTVADNEQVEFFEGCLSVVGFTALVARNRAVRVECLNERAEPVVIEARGWPARILQHEIDHLNGFLYVDRMVRRSFMTTTNHARYWKDRSIESIRAALALDGDNRKPS
jgi:peptide deformylase